MSIYYDEGHVRIWHGYKIYEMGEFTLRSGVGLIGLTDMANPHETIAERFYRRGESILEHTSKLAYLCSTFSSNFPGGFNALNPFTDRFYKSDSGIIEDWLIFAVALTHDIPEVFTGDIPDDGSRAHADKDEIERMLYEEKIAPAYSHEDYMLIREFFNSFQNHDTPAGRALYCLDKLEAVLQLLWLERYEAYGLITAKLSPTGQDIHYMKLTGTPCATDCWAAHLKDRIKDFPTAITRHIYGVLYVAVMDIRGEWFPWWNKI